MAGFLSPTAARDDFSRLLASPAQFLPSPLAPGLFASPAAAAGKASFAVQEGRLSFDLLLQEHDSQESSQGACPLEGLREPGGDAGAAPKEPFSKARSASHLELFALAPPAAERPKLAEDAGAPEALAAEQQQLQAALTQKIMDKLVAAKQAEAKELVAGVASKYGLAADYNQAEETIKAVWAEELQVQVHGSHASSAAGVAAAVQHPAMAQQLQANVAAEDVTLGGPGKGSSDTTTCDEEAGQQATSALKPPQAVRAAGDGGNVGKRPLMESQPSFAFPVAAQHAMAADDVALKRRRVQYDRMRELESQVQRVRHLGDALKQSLRQAESQHKAIALENEQLWNALLHIHASLRAAHAAQLRQQVAMHTAAVAAALPPPKEAEEPSPDMLFGSLFSPDADELAAACGMFISPAKPAQAAVTANKPRKLFLEDDAKALLGSAARALPDSGGKLGDLPMELSPALWIPAV